MSSKNVNVKKQKGIYHNDIPSDTVLYALFQQLDKETISKKQAITRLSNASERVKNLQLAIKERLGEIKK